MNVALKSLQLILGMLTGLVGIIGVLGGAGYYFFVTQMSTRPPKPVFAEERDRGKPKPKPKPKATVVAKPTPSPAVKGPQNPDAPDKLPPEAYDAKVVWKDGLSLKKEPDPGAQKVGSVAFNGKVAIVKTSDDKQWVFIQSQMENAQGWVKAGNIDKVAVAANAVPAAPKSVKTKVSARARRVKPQPETGN